MGMKKTFKNFSAATLLLSSVFFSAAQGGELPTSTPTTQTPDSSVQLIEKLDKQQLQDLTSHPLAGTKVKIKIKVSDAPGQTGQSKEIEVVLPQRKFKNPIAPLLAEMRRDLATDTRTAPEVLARLYGLIQEWQEKVISEKALSELEKLHEGMTESENKAVQEQAKELAKLIQEQKKSIIKPVTLNRLEQVHQNLAGAQDEKALEQVVSDLWSIMLQLEEDVLTEAEKKLRDAKDALREALEKGATAEELEKLMKEAQDALEEFLKEQAEEGDINDDPAAKEDYERMRETMEKIKELMKELGLQDNPEMAKKLQEMLENMQEMSNQTGQQNMSSEQMREMMQQMMQQMQQQMEQMQQMQESIKDLEELVKEQQELMDKTAQESKKHQQDMVEIEKALEEYASHLKEKIKEQSDIEENRAEEMAREKEEQEVSSPSENEKISLKNGIAENRQRRARLGFMDEVIDNFLEKLKTIKQEQKHLDESEAGGMASVLSEYQKELERMRPKNETPQNSQNQNGGQKNGNQQGGQNSNQQQGGDRQQEKDLADKIREMMNSLKNLGKDQQGLQEKLRDIQDALRQKNIDPGELNNAETKMNDAKRQLNTGESGKAVSSQNEALDALRQGMQQMQQQLQTMKQGGAGMGSSVEQGGAGKNIQEKIDPSGRSNANDDTGVDPAEQENIVRPIRDVIRENLKNPDLPDAQREYLEGLLKKLSVEEESSPNGRKKPSALSP